MNRQPNRDRPAESNPGLREQSGYRFVAVSQQQSTVAAPFPTLGISDAIALIIGLVVGAGIFRTASLVAAHAGTESSVLLAWLVGAVVSLVGAMCYAELATTYPNAGGELHYLTRAYGKNLAFLFAWARLTVIPTGSVALIAFVFGDYASQVLHLGSYSSSVYAGIMVVALTTLNILGVRHGKRAQKFLTGAEILGVLIIIVAGLLFATPREVDVFRGGGSGSGVPSHAAWGLMMVFVLLTYGGWNDAAYISAEIRGPRRNMARALLVSISVVAVLYLLVNLAFVRGLGLDAMARSQAVASDLMQLTAGRHGAQLISMLIAVSALTSANATILVGARSNYALGRDYSLFSSLGHWDAKTGTPVNALIVQGIITLALVLLGGIRRKGFETMVEYTAPVFWFFVLMIGISLFILRVREPQTYRPFRVPLYPLTPLVFCATSAYIFYSSLAYTGIGALVGIAVLAAGALLRWLTYERKPVKSY